MAVVTAAQFVQQTARAKRAANGEPVFITTRGRQTHVLMSIEHYGKIAHTASLTPGDLLAMPDDAPDVDLPLSRPVQPSRHIAALAAELMDA